MSGSGKPNTVKCNNAGKPGCNVMCKHRRPHQEENDCCLGEFLLPTGQKKSDGFNCVWVNRWVRCVRVDRKGKNER